MRTILLATLAVFIAVSLVLSVGQINQRVVALEQAAAFYSTPLSISIISPRINATWLEGRMRSIRWTAVGLPRANRFNIQLLTPTNPTGYIIASDTPPVYLGTSFKYAWTVGSIVGASVPVPPGNYQIRVCAQRTLTCGVSPIFAISLTFPTPPPLTTISVLSPNGGETWRENTNQSISWTDSAALSSPTHYLVWLVSPTTTPQALPSLSFLTGRLIADFYPPDTSLSKNMPWSSGHIPKNISNLALPGSYKIAVCRVGDKICDASNNAFTLAAP